MAQYGSFVDSMAHVRNENDLHEFYGLSADIAELPTEGIRSGSTAYCVDTGDIYIFEETNQQWHKQ